MALHEVCSLRPLRVVRVFGWLTPRAQNDIFSEVKWMPWSLLILSGNERYKECFGKVLHCGFSALKIFMALIYIFGICEARNSQSSLPKRIQPWTRNHCYHWPGHLPRETIRVAQEFIELCRRGYLWARASGIKVTAWSSVNLANPWGPIHYWGWKAGMLHLVSSHDRGYVTHKMCKHFYSIDLKRLLMWSKWCGRGGASSKIMTPLNRVDSGIQLSCKWAKAKDPGLVLTHK